MWSESSYSTDILFTCKRKRKPRCMISGYNPLCCSQFSAETWSVSVARWDFNITIYNSLSKHKVNGNPTLPRNLNYRGFTSVNLRYNSLRSNERKSFSSYRSIKQTEPQVWEDRKRTQNITFNGHSIQEVFNFNKRNLALQTWAKRHTLTAKVGLFNIHIFCHISFPSAVQFQ